MHAQAGCNTIVSSLSLENAFQGNCTSSFHDVQHYHPTYDWNLSTEENYKVEDGEYLHYGPFKHIRENLDYGFHTYYARERQELQDKIVQYLLQRHVEGSNASTRRGCPRPSSRWVIFTAGCMGAGKSFTVQRLDEQGLFPLRWFVMVDPDEIRRLLPEFRTYLQKNAEQAGAFTRKEAGMLAEILSVAALERGLNVLKDGSLRDAQWYVNYFSKLRHSFPGIQLGIIHVTAPIEIVHERVKKRAEQTGRIVPRDVLERAIVEVPRSVYILKHLVDFFLEIDNSIQQDHDGGDGNIVITAGISSLELMRDHFLAECDP
jgi:predicted kinase